MGSDPPATPRFERSSQVLSYEQLRALAVDLARALDQTIEAEYTPRVPRPATGPLMMRARDAGLLEPAMDPGVLVDEG